MKQRDLQPPEHTINEPRTLRQEQAALRRAQIVEVALRLFARQGFDGTSTKQIAQAAGVAEGLIFHYFPTKAQLLAAVLQTHHSFAGELRTLLADAADIPASTMLPRLAAGWLDTLRREADITAVLFGTAQTNIEVGEALRTLIAEGIARLAAYLHLRMEAGELRANLAVETSAHMFFASLMIFFVVHRLLPADEWQQRADAFVDEMVSVWLSGARSAGESLPAHAYLATARNTSLVDPTGRSTYNTI
jgi:AcrR family transcriptional regulator